MPRTQRLLQQLLDERLNGRLDDYVAERRHSGLSWRRIAADLQTDTGVEVSDMSLITWYREQATSGDAA